MDQNPVMEKPRGHYTHDLIGCRRLFNILIEATKSSEGMHIIFQCEQSTKAQRRRSEVEWEIYSYYECSVWQVRTAYLSNVRVSWAANSVESGASSFGNLFCFVKSEFFENYDFFHWFESNFFKRNFMRTLHFETYLLWKTIQIRNFCKQVDSRWKMKTFEKRLKIVKFIKSQNARFCVSDNIDFWYREIHMTDKYFSKMKKMIFLKNEKYDE